MTEPRVKCESKPPSPTAERKEKRNMSGKRGEGKEEGGFTNPTYYRTKEWYPRKKKKETGSGIPA